jgi:hypothetical protein
MNHFLYTLCITSFVIPSLHAPQVTIDQPGLFLLDVTRAYSPTTNNDSIINITSSNVTLDFQGNSISQGSNNTQTGLDGVAINSGLTNITIKNAHIQNLSGVGIRINSACTKITIKDSLIETCYSGGILLSGPGVSGIEVGNTRISTCTGVNGGPAYGIRSISAAAANIHDCIINQNDASTTSSGYGISLENSQLCVLSDNNIVSNGGSGIAAGISLTACNNVILQNLFVANTICHDTTYAGTAYGFYINQSTNTLSLNCRSAANINSSSYCYGLAVQDGQKNVFESFISGFNKATQQCAGILLQNESQSILNNSISRGNSTTVAGTAYGILLTGTCDQCSLNTNQLLNNKGVTATFGILDQRNPSTSIILGNLAFNNGTNFSVTFPFGVTLPVTTASLSVVPGTTNINASNSYLNVNFTP